jgi:hypothetical protein
MQDEGLRIAWQYKKYLGDEKASHGGHRGGPLLIFFFLLFYCCLYSAVHPRSCFLSTFRSMDNLEIYKMKKICINH